MGSGWATPARSPTIRRSHRRRRPANIVKSLVDAVATLSAHGAEPFSRPHRFDDAGWVANRWCEILPLPVDAKQRLLSLEDPLSRLDIVDSLLRS